MILIMMRHAEAVPVGGATSRDADRVLTSRGEEDARIMGGAFSMLDPLVSCVLTSPLVRAQQSGRIVASQFVSPPVVRPTENLSPGFRYQALLDEVLGLGEASHLIAIGHQPDLTNFISWIIANAASEIALGTASAACLSVQKSGSGPEALLRWLLSPDLVRHLQLKS